MGEQYRIEPKSSIDVVQEYCTELGGELLACVYAEFLQSR